MCLWAVSKTNIKSVSPDRVPMQDSTYRFHAVLARFELRNSAYRHGPTLFYCSTSFCSTANAPTGFADPCFVLWVRSATSVLCRPPYVHMVKTNQKSTSEVKAKFSSGELFFQNFEYFFPSRWREIEEANNVV